MQELLDHVHLSGLVRLIRSEEFPGMPESVSLARKFIRSVCKGIGVDLDSAVLLVSEAATNAVVHAGSPFRVTVVALVGRPPWIEVQDRSPERPKRRVASSEDDSGRGLELLDALSVSWHTDVDKASGNKIICFTPKGDQNESGTEADPASGLTALAS
ncbi:ATP-binding protein [Kitasatospora sp. NBC_01302]|uniref:ATP-binding protein n=1 Tax=Kitasatospora sp. NBC_01302 TaxID=2903575 RepID=UPI002E0D4FD4|nr:ATP-binding protein [Kitasatospora sp. NBC_01302]